MQGVTVISDVASAHYNGGHVPTYVRDATGERIARTRYVHTDAWRGYWTVEPVKCHHWRKVGDGCNCGTWEDAPPGTSDAECQEHLAELVAEYGEVVVVLCGGSNLFAMPYDVLAKVA